MAILFFAMAPAAACAGKADRSEDPTAADSEFVKRLGRDLVAAQEAGASEEQLAVLERARESGEVSFEEYSAAVGRALRCLREAGVAVQDHGVDSHQGLEKRSYSVPIEAADRRTPLGYSVHRCVAEHSFWVERAYQLQPSSVEEKEAHFAEYRDAILDCLANNDIDVPDEWAEASRADLNEAFRGDRQKQKVYGGCLHESGYSRS